MGNLLKTLGDRYATTGIKIDLFVDFENALPTESEREVYDGVISILQHAPQLVEEIKAYPSGTKEIKDAIENPKNVQIQENTWRVIIQSVRQLKRFWQFSIQLDTVVVPQLLSALCNTSMSPYQHLESQQALAKLFADTIHFVLLFDDMKVMLPSIQNDFSYYKRTLNKNIITFTNHLQDGAAPDLTGGITTEEANHMTLFFAEAMPMLSCFTRSANTFLNQNCHILPKEYATECFSTFAAVCKIMIENPEYSERFTNGDTRMFCIRVMIGTIILYDHVHPEGAFVKTSNIDIRGCIKILQSHPECHNLVNALRYNTKHLLDEATPKAIKLLFT